MQSIGSRLDNNGGVGPGFDTLRLVLAILIMIYHSYDVVMGPTASVGKAWLLVECLLPIFFALSGFLITASGQRLRLAAFLLHRGLRIFPALAVEVFFSAFLLGAAVTSIKLREYFLSSQLYGYCLNIIGRIHYFLPGVYVNHPHDGMVNASLWTIPWELGCYVLISGAIITGVIYHKRWIALIAIMASMMPVILYSILILIAHFFPSVNAVSHLLENSVYLNPQSLDTSTLNIKAVTIWLIALLTGWQFRVIPFFLAGSAFYLYRHSIRYSPLAALLVVIGLLTATTLVPERLDSPLLNIILCPALVYLMAFVGVSKITLPAFLKKGDYSYGIYLYAYPLQQAVYGWGLDRRSWQLNAVLSLILVTLLAAFSWHLIEKPILSRRRYLEGLILKRQMGNPSLPAKP